MPDEEPDEEVTAVETPNALKQAVAEARKRSGDRWTAVTRERQAELERARSG